MSSIKVAHFGNYAPNQCGMFATTKDTVLAERAVGLDARFIDWGHAREQNQQYSRVGLTYQGITTESPQWAIDEADILVLHSAMHPAVKKTGKPIVMAIHGRPEYSFVLEKLGKGSCIALYHQYAKDPQFKRFFTYWQEHLIYWNLLFKKKTEYVPAMVDLDFYNPNGEKFDFKTNSGKPNILIADIWREDVTPFNVLFAAAEFIKKYAPEGKIHVFGLSKPNENTAMSNILNPLKEQGIVGEVHGLVPYMEKVYRAVDFVVTPHNFATRVVREALACGCPIVTGEGNCYTDWQEDPHCISDFALKIEECWNQELSIPEFAKTKREETRKIAEKEFNLKNAGESLKRIYEDIMKEPKPVVEIVSKKYDFKVYNFVAYSNEKNLGKNYNEYMNLISDNDWACFIDHDAMFTVSDWYKQLCNVIEKNPEYGCFTVVTNRIGNPGQRFVGIDQNNHDIKYHREIGEMAQQQFGIEIKDITNEHYLSGVVMLVSKKVWKEVSGFKEGFLGVDNDFHTRLKNKGLKVGLMKGIYVYHYYRAGNESLKPVEK